MRSRLFSFRLFDKKEGGVFQEFGRKGWGWEGHLCRPTLFNKLKGNNNSASKRKSFFKLTSLKYFTYFIRLNMINECANF